MPSTTTASTTSSILPIDVGGVNCYLLRAGDGFILVDTGFAPKRADLEQALTRAGCRPGNLKLILLTHGDMDHAGNCAYLHKLYGAPVGMHRDDVGMVEHNDMGWNRKAKPDRVAIVFRVMLTFFRNSPPIETFTPDLYVEDGQDLAPYGAAAQVLHLPGHSKGSIGVLTADGGLMCGDLIYNLPGFGLIDDLPSHTASLKKLRAYPVQTLYPGHGQPCPAAKFIHD